jgi:hypothetical protein
LHVRQGLGALLLEGVGDHPEVGVDVLQRITKYMC